MSFGRQLVIPGLELTATVALARGDACVKQCAQCGTLVYVPSGALRKLGACPSCRHTEWWTQHLPVGPFTESDRCCEREGEYNGFGSDGPFLFECPTHCACHD